MAIVGRPNVGKSTLLNRVVGQKLAIVSSRPQTTRNRIVGVYNDPAGQIVFVDTPGVHPARGRLNKFMVEEALSAIGEVDVVLLVIEAPDHAPAVGLPAGAAAVDASEGRLLDLARHAGKPVMLALNKVDKVKAKSVLFPVLQSWSERENFLALVPISATRGKGVEDLVRELLRALPKGPPLYGPDMLTDRSERFLTAELVREQIFLRLYQELPYATAVEIESWEERPQGDVVIEAAILVERDSQRGIVVGKGAAMIREVGIAARGEISQLLGRPAHLKLHVKVSPDWTESPAVLGDLGYRAEKP